MENVLIPYGSVYLNGVWHKAPDSLYTVIVSHGFRGSKDGGGRAVDMAEAMSEQFDVLRYDFTPLSTLTEQCRQLEAVISYVKEHTGGSIILFGRSMGADASLFTAAKRDDIKGLVLWSMPFDLIETFSLSLGKDNLDKLKSGIALELDDEWGQAELKPFFYTDLLAHDATLALEKLPQMPILFVHGENDEIVPVRQAKAAFEAAKQPKTLKIIGGGDHRFIYKADESREAVMLWLEENFSKKDV